MSKPVPTTRKLDLAPSAQGSYKDCGQKINQGACRVERLAASQWHDGFDSLVYHPQCRGHRTSSVDLITNLGSVRWEEQLRLLDTLNIPVNESAAAVKAQKARCDKVWALVDALVDSSTPSNMTTFLQANGIELEKLRGGKVVKKAKHDMAYAIADSILHGKPTACPLCKGNEVYSCHAANETEPTGVCFGMFGATPCTFGHKSAEGVAKFDGVHLRREGVHIPESLAKAKGFKDLPKPKLKAGGGPAGAPSGAGAAAAAPKSAGAGKKREVGELSLLVVPVDEEEEALPEYKKLKVGELKAKLEARGLETEGVKAALVTRLEKADTATTKKGKAPAKAVAAVGKGKKNKAVTDGDNAGAKAKAARVFKGTEEVLQRNPSAPPGEVLVADNGHTVYNTTLSNVDLSSGMNKYYILQLLKSSSRYITFKKWGRVGEEGSGVGGGGGYGGWGYGRGDPSSCGDSSKVFESEAEAVKEFVKTFKTKTGNNWADRADFKNKGLYVMKVLEGQDAAGEAAAEAALQEQLAADTAADAAAAAVKGDAAGGGDGDGKPVKAAAGLPPRVKDFMKLIFDDKATKEQLKSLSYNVDKMPLGKLSTPTILEAYKLLTDLSTLVDPAPDAGAGGSAADPADAVPAPKPAGKGKAKTAAKKAAVVAAVGSSIESQRKEGTIKSASTRFYELIPHVFTSTPPLLRSQAQIQEKIDLLDTLTQMASSAAVSAAAVRRVEAAAAAKAGQSGKAAAAVSQVASVEEEKYRAMGCELEPVERGGEVWNQIEAFVQNSIGCKDAGGTSLPHSTKLELVDLFVTNREGEASRFTTDKTLTGNRMLLWHGSRTTNWGGILKTGLRIAPPEAPASGYLFGKGLYFADSLQKSAHYCRVGHGRGVCALLEVALGEPLQCKTSSMPGAKENVARKNKGHLLALGKNIPGDAVAVLPDGAKVPNAPFKEHSDKMLQARFNEYVVYAEEQAKLSYVMVVDFKK